MSGKRKITNHLMLLQSKIKREPDAYVEDFKMQYEHFKAQMCIFTNQSPKWNDELAELLLFIAHVLDKYKFAAEEYIEMLTKTITLPTMNDCDMRSVMINCLMLLRRKDLITPVVMYKILLSLVKHRGNQMLFGVSNKFIIRDIQLVRKKTKLYDSEIVTLLSENMRGMDRKCALFAIEIATELYRKQIWIDERLINEISYCCFSKIPRVRVKALRFLLCYDEFDDSEGSDEEPEQQQIKHALLAHRVGKKTKHRAKKKENILRAIKRKTKNKDPLLHESFHLRALRDPQGFTEKLFQYLEKCQDSYNVKMMLQDLISRLIGVHSLILLNFYPNIQRYLTPRQPEVTKILLYAAQATHELVPPDVIQEMTNCIANNFVNERNTVEAMTVGLNAIREICKRCPMAIADHLIEELGSFRSYKDKNVSSAARSFINVLRDNNPASLPRKLRSKPTEEEQSLRKSGVQFGEKAATDIIPGSEILIRDDPQRCKDQEKLHRKTVQLVSSKFLTDEELLEIRKERIRRAVDLIGRKCQVSSESEDEDELPSLADIERYRQKAKDTIEEVKRQEKEAGVQKPKFGRRKKKKGGLSNKAKKGSKLFMMMKHKYKHKIKRSLRDKQIALKRGLEKQKRMK